MSALAQEAALPARRGLVVFDADDTLWSLAPIYTAVEQECAEIAQRHGLDGEAFKRLRVRHDIALVEVYHFGMEHFPEAARRAFVELARAAGLPWQQIAAGSRAIRAKAHEVHERPAVLTPGVARVLERLAPTHTLYLLTKGDDLVQRRRLSTSGLAHHFDAVVVVGHKDKAAFRALCLRAGVAPRDAWTVGNSLRSDIEPARAIGMNAIWVPADGTFAYEDVPGGPDRAHSGSFAQTRRLAQVPAMVARRLARQERTLGLGD